MFSNDILDYQVAVFKALGHHTRLNIIEILATEGDKYVSELVERLGFDQSTISKHLSILKSVDIVNCKKEGLNVVYSLNMKCVHQFMRCVQTLAKRSRENIESEGSFDCGLMCQGERH